VVFGIFIYRKRTKYMDTCRRKAKISLGNKSDGRDLQHHLEFYLDTDARNTRRRDLNPHDTILYEYRNGLYYKADTA